MENIALLLTTVMFFLESVLVVSLFCIRGALSQREKEFFVGVGLLALVILVARLVLGAIGLVNVAGYVWLGVLLLGLWWGGRKRHQEGHKDGIELFAWQKWLVWITLVLSFLVGVTYLLR